MWCSRGCLGPPAISVACLWHASIAGGARRRGCAAAGVPEFFSGGLGLGDLHAPALADAQRAPAGEQLEQLRAHELAAPALQGADVGLGLTAAGGDDDRREIGARRDQL